MVGVAGFEPATTRTPSVCATRLRHTPTAKCFGARAQAAPQTRHYNFPRDCTTGSVAGARNGCFGPRRGRCKCLTVSFLRKRADAIARTSVNPPETSTSFWAD